MVDDDDRPPSVLLEAVTLGVSCFVGSEPSIIRGETTQSDVTGQGKMADHV